MAARNLPEEVEVELGLDDESDEAALRQVVARKLGVPPAELPAPALLRRSIDARRGSVRFHLIVGLRPTAAEPLGGGCSPRARG